jgi:hypothetical protein
MKRNLKNRPKRKKGNVVGVLPFTRKETTKKRESACSTQEG